MATTRVTTASGPWPLFAAAAAKEVESRALREHAPQALMERAGLAVARLARAIAPHAQAIEVWCGPGNNGGDGYVAARWLHEAGMRITLRAVNDATRLPPDAAEARRKALAAGLREDAAEEGVPIDLVIDGLLGLGSSRAPSGALAETIHRINARGAPTLAIDLPSGLNPDTGQPFGDAVVHAAHTLAPLTLKPGLFTAQGRDLAGTVWFDDLGVQAAASDVPPTCSLLGPAPRRTLALHAAHKGSQGDCWVVGGAPGMVGAAWLAGRAALAAGAGRVYVHTLSEGTTWPYDPSRPELMARPLGAQDSERLRNTTAVCGCGGGAAVRAPMLELLTHAARLVLDADALNAIAAEPALLRLLQGRAGRGQATLLTPHPLEAARLLGTTSAAVQADRLGHARALAARVNATVVLKGSGSVIAESEPGGREDGSSAGHPSSATSALAINPSGNAALATAGTGDVLAGWIGGLWAQRASDSAFEIACEAVCLHGHAADLARGEGASVHGALLAADLITAMSAAA
jgi:ADP-dependent NAD(P)H-hydrate dehydratase / NAD(P)H-hydrate epimerase